MDFNLLNFLINLSIVFIFALTWVGIAFFVGLKKKKSFVYLLFFTIFYIYIVKVLDYTLFQYQSLLLLKRFMPNLMLQGQTTEEATNLIPLINLTSEDIKTSLLNIVLMIPFGFGLPFITNFRLNKVIIIGCLFSILIEFLQLLTGFIGKTSFRIADINDVIFNTLGVVIGYILFVELVRILRAVSKSLNISEYQILQYIIKRPQVDE